MKVYELEKIRNNKNNINNSIRRGDIFLLNVTGLTDILGNNIQEGYRPYIVLQNNKGNKYSPVFEVAPISSQIQKVLPQHVMIDTIFLEKKSIVLTEQVITVNKSKLTKKLGTCPRIIMDKIDRTLKMQMGLLQPINWQEVADLVGGLKSIDNMIEVVGKTPTLETLKRGIVRSLEKISKNHLISIHEFMNMFDSNGKRIEKLRAI